ncbi:MAG: acetyl-CoA acetyltransferase, partial [Rhizomicrobium sp.]
VETYTVVVDRRGKRFGIVIGRLEDGKRFLAHTQDDDAMLDWMTREEILGQHGTVTPGEVTNLFRFG